MIYLPLIGIISDVVNYGTFYFCKPAIVKLFSDGKYNLDEAFSFFDEIKNICKPLPLCLIPFFYFDAVTLSALSEYMLDCLEKSDNLYEYEMLDLLDSIQNKDKFKLFILNFLFSNLDKNEMNKLINGDSIIQGSAIDNKPWT